MYDFAYLVSMLPSMPLFPFVVAGCAFVGIWSLFWRWEY